MPRRAGPRKHRIGFPPRPVQGGRRTLQKVQLVILLAAALLLAPQAAPTGADADGRCIAVLGSMGSKGNPQTAAMAQAGILYYVGKLKGRNASTNVGAVVMRAAQQATAQKANPQNELKRCGAELNVAGQSLRGVNTGKAPAPKR